MISVTLAGLMTLASCTAGANDQSPPEGEDRLTQEELAEARVDCLAEHGWEVELNDDGTFTADVPDAQSDKYEEDNAACLEESGIEIGRELTSEEWDTLYEAHVEGAECLNEGGWSVSEAPTFEVFKETYYTSDPWLPWAEVPQGSRSKALERCPMPGPTY